jgi:integrase
MERAVDLPGAAHLVLANGVVHLDPATAVFEAMLEGWARQQRTRFLKQDSTIKPRLSLVRRLATFSNLYPWQWEPAEVEAFFDHLRSRNPNFTVSTARQYQNSLRMFCDFICDGRYGWIATCQEQFGQVPAQILHEHNRVTHVAEFEGQPGRRPLTYEEVQALFDAADGRVEEIRVRRRKGALAAMRDSALLKTFYAYGLRRQEMVGLDLTDLRHNPRHRTSAGTARCSSGSASRPTVALPSAAPCSQSRRWTGSWTCSATTSPRSDHGSTLASTRRSG